VLTPAFLSGEYRTVVLGMPEPTREAYLQVKRTGRGVRLNRVQRAAVWNVIEEFRSTGLRRVASGRCSTWRAAAPATS
jgi:hypothetical protein